MQTPTTVLIKFWPRAKGVDDSDLEDIWRSEIRQLQRLVCRGGAARREAVFGPVLTHWDEAAVYGLVGC